jgi:hypothetical protein
MKCECSPNFVYLRAVSGCRLHVWTAHCECMWKEAVVAYFKIIFRHFVKELRKTTNFCGHSKQIRNSYCPSEVTRWQDFGKVAE